MPDQEQSQNLWEATISLISISPDGEPIPQMQEATDEICNGYTEYFNED